jgi:hypothetical protein
VKKLSLLDKNAYLSIYVTENLIVANLAYSHYEIQRSYVLSDTTQHGYFNGELESTYFWEKYFEGLQKKWDWQVLQERSTQGSFRQIQDFLEEGDGIAKIKIQIWNHFKKLPTIVEAIRSLSPQITVETVDQKRIGQKVASATDKLGYDEVLHLDLNPTVFRYNKIAKTSLKSNLKNIRVPTWDITAAKVNWDNRFSLIDSVRNSRFRAFMSLEDRGAYKNNWANYVLKPNLGAVGGSLLDVLRSYITVQLFSSFNDHTDIFKGFGTDKEIKSLIVISGLLQYNLPHRQMLLAILDGLQMRGRFDVLWDRDEKLVTLGDQYAQGINATDYIVTSNQMSFIPHRVYCPEVPGKGTENKVVFDAQNINTQTGETSESSDASLQPIYALSNQFMEYTIPKKGKSFITGHFIKGAYVEGCDEEVSFSSEADEDIRYEKLFVDARFKPTVYGPTAKVNRKNLNKWLA